MSIFKQGSAVLSALLMAVAMAVAAPSAAHAQGGGGDSPVYGDNVKFISGVNVEPGHVVAVN